MMKKILKKIQLLTLKINIKKLIGERSKFVYKIGDKVKVRVIEANKQLRKVAFEIILNEEENIENEEDIDSEN